MPGERIGRRYLPAEDHASGWRWSRKRGAGPSALLHQAHELSILEMYQLGVATVQVGGLEHAKVELRVCPRCHARRRALYSFGGRVGCRGKDCLDLRYRTSHDLRRAEVDIERIKELLRRSKTATTRKMRKRWLTRAEAAHAKYLQRVMERSERRSAAITSFLSIQEAAHEEYLRQRNEGE
jgi:hypothetical protein